MYRGFQISNIIEQTCSQDKPSVLCTPHMSVFDLFLHACDLDLYAYDNNNTHTNDNDSFIVYWPNQNVFGKSYDAFISNKPLEHARQNPATTFHLNSIVFAHDTSLVSVKKEDMYLICLNNFRSNDHLVFFPEQMSMFGCNKIQRTPMTYAVPDELQITNESKTKIGTFCYNKQLSDDLVSMLGSEISVIKKLPSTLDELNNELNEYKVLIEFDPFSVINLLSGIACGSIGILVDPNHSMAQYADIPNLYMVRSIDELQQLLKNIPEFNKDAQLPQKYRNFAGFKNLVNQIFVDNKRKAFVL